MLKIKPYLFPDIFGRVAKLGFQLNYFQEDSMYADLVEFDVVYLPTGWGRKAGKIDGLARQYQLFVEEGGGLVAEQPNHDGDYSPAVFPFPMIIGPRSRRPNSWPPDLITPHYITEGVSKEGLPGPDNRVSGISPQYTVLLRSARRDFYPTLVTLEYGDGRIVFYSSSASRKCNDKSHQVSDEFLRRVFLWAAARDAP